MHWIAPSEKDVATSTLEKRLWDAAAQFRANSGLKSQEYSAPVRTTLNPNPADITEVMGDIGKLLDASITGVDMPSTPAPVMDLAKIDFKALRKRFKVSRHKKADLEVFKAAIRAQLEKLIRLNKTRADFAEKSEELPETYDRFTRKSVPHFSSTSTKAIPNGMRGCMRAHREHGVDEVMNPKRPQSLAEKEAEARQNSVLLKFAYHTTPTKGMMPPKRYRHVQPELLAVLEELVEAVAKYNRITGHHLPILGELGELLAEIMFGTERHAPMTQGSDGKLGNDLLTVKTITPGKKNDTVQVKRAGNFGKLVVVQITDDFQFGARMVSRSILNKGEGQYARISWDSMIAGEPDQELHRNFPTERVPPCAG